MSVGVPVGDFSVEPVRRGVLESHGELGRVPPWVTITVGDAVEVAEARAKAGSEEQLVESGAAARGAGAGVAAATVIMVAPQGVRPPLPLCVAVGVPVGEEKGMPRVVVDAAGVRLRAALAQCEGAAVPRDEKRGQNRKSVRL